MTVKIVVPTLGRRLSTAGVLGTIDSRAFTGGLASELVVVGVAGHRPFDQRRGSGGPRVISAKA